MTVAIGCALLAIGLIALSTPRQAGQVFAAPRAPSLVRLRLAGWALLLGSLAVAVGGDDAVRNLIGWITASGVIALTIALTFSAAYRRR